jgi:hypothetical protein
LTAPDPEEANEDEETLGPISPLKIDDRTIRVDEQATLVYENFIGYYDENERFVPDENAVLHNGVTLPMLSRELSWEIHRIIREETSSYRKYLRLAGFSEEDIKEMTTIFMVDGKDYLLSDSETPSMRLTPGEILERDVMRATLERREAQEIALVQDLRDEMTTTGSENFDPAHAPVVPSYKYSPAIWENMYASYDLIQSEFQSRYFDLEMSRVWREASVRGTKMFF